MRAGFAGGVGTVIRLIFVIALIGAPWGNWPGYGGQGFSGRGQTDGGDTIQGGTHGRTDRLSAPQGRKWVRVSCRPAGQGNRRSNSNRVTPAKAGVDKGIG